MRKRSKQNKKKKNAGEAAHNAEGSLWWKKRVPGKNGKSKHGQTKDKKREKNGPNNLGPVKLFSNQILASIFGPEETQLTKLQADSINSRNVKTVLDIKY